MTTGIALLDGTRTSADERREFLDLLSLTPGSRLLEVGDAAVDGPDETYDAVLCIDGIAGVSDRRATLASWARALKPGGRLLYTDPAIIAGLVTSDEVAIRGGLGFLVLSPQGENEGLIDSAGLRLLRADDATDAWVLHAESLRRKRAGREPELVSREGRERYDAVQRFLEVGRRLAVERRLARIAFLAEKVP